MADSPVYVSLEFTPNPNTLKYSVNKTLMEFGGANFTRKEDADERSPLASKLFAIPGICGVMIGKDFVTVTKSENGDWDVVHEKASKTIETHLGSGEKLLNQEPEPSSHETQANSEVEKKIIELLDREIRPAVAMDGGDITFEKFEKGIVYLYLQGSCAGCPSATATLKQGIEVRMKDQIPEVKEVVSV